MKYIPDKLKAEKDNFNTRLPLKIIDKKSAYCWTTIHALKATNSLVFKVSVVVDCEVLLHRLID